MNRARILAYVTGTVDQELLLQNEYLAAENRILKAKLKGRVRFGGRRFVPSSRIGSGSIVSLCPRRQGECVPHQLSTSATASMRRPPVRDSRSSRSRC
jgi:hypothetical protein